MTEEEKKELQELRDMKELQELRAAKLKQEQVQVKQNVQPSSTPKKSGSNGCAVWMIIGFVVMLVFALCTGRSNSGSTSENYNDNSQYHQILAKNYFKDYLKEQRLKDPDSYDEIGYTSVYNDYRKCYVVDLKFRARNSFGGMVIERWMADVKFEGTTVSYKNITKLE